MKHDHKQAKKPENSDSYVKQDYYLVKTSHALLKRQNLWALYIDLAFSCVEQDLCSVDGFFLISQVASSYM